MKFHFLAHNAKSIYDRILILILIFTTPLLFFGNQLLPGTEQFKSLWNLGHIPFSFVAVLFLHTRIKLIGWKRGVWLLFFTLLGSVILECAQATIGREASLHDVARNTTGAGIAWFWIQTPNAIIWLGRILFLALLLNETLKTGKVFYGQYLFETQLPIISNFEHTFDIQRWQGSIETSDKFSSSGSFSLKGSLGLEQFSNIQIQGNPQDWSNYQALSFDIYNEQEDKIELMLRIHDESHAFGPYRWRYSDRFNKNLALDPGWNHYQISLDDIKNAPTQREIELNKIVNLQIFVVDSETKITIFLDNLRLN